MVEWHQSFYLSVTLCFPGCISDVLFHDEGDCDEAKLRSYDYKQTMHNASKSGRSRQLSDYDRTKFA